MLTDQQARDLLHLAADTVPVSPAPAGVESRGRVWLVVAAAAAVALVLSGSLVVKRIALEDEPSEPDVDPLTTEALRNYDPAAMPDLMDKASRAVFSRSIAELPTSQFKASDGADERLPTTRYREARSMEVLYPLPDQHELWLHLGHGKSFAEGDPERICEASLRSGASLDCKTQRVGDDVAVVTIEATADGWMGPDLGLHPDNRGDVNDRLLVLREDLDAVDPNALFFERKVKFVHSETFVSVVEEAVHVSDLAQAELAFQVPVSDMIELATNPTMVIPEPASQSASEGTSELASAGGQPCPSTLPYAGGDGFGTTTPAASPVRVMKPDQAWVCGYAPDLSSRGPQKDQRLVVWRQSSAAVELGKGQIRDVVPRLKAPAPADGSPQVCTDDLGTRLLLVLSTDGDLTGVAVDSFGCGKARLTENPHVTEPGDPSQTTVVGGAFQLHEALLQQLSLIAGEGQGN